MFSFGSIKLGKIFGFEVELDYSWFIIFVLVSLNLTLNFFHTYGFSLLVSIFDGILTAILFFSSVVFHEFFHSLIARFNKLPIKKITLFIFGGVAQMTEEPKSPVVEFKMAIAGPLSSLFLALVFWLIFLSLKILNLTEAATAPFSWLALINLWLALFNLAPGFPLDGGRVLRAALWYWYKDVERATKIASQFGQGFAYLLVGIGVLTAFFGYLGGVWLIVLGLFLNRVAQSSYQQLILQKYLSGIKISEIMTRDILTVSPNITLETLVNDYFLKHKFGRFPVIDEGKVVGVVTLHHVKEIPRESWQELTAADAMDKVIKDCFVSPDEDAGQALIRMAKCNIGHLLVVSDSKLVGLVTRSDIIRLIKVKTELGA